MIIIKNSYEYFISIVDLASSTSTVFCVGYGHQEVTDV